MFAATHSVALVGVEARAIRVEAHVGGGEKGRLNVVGLPDTAVREAKDRVMAAMAVSGYRFPARTVTVNLAPADLPKSGSAYDLPIALALLAAAGEIPSSACDVVASASSRWMARSVRPEVDWLRSSPLAHWSRMSPSA